LLRDPQRDAPDSLGYIPLFKELGVGVMQITYNTQNLAGAGCYG
jgi:membrane dipeptidase